MTYYTRIKKDKYREKHIEEINKLISKLNDYKFGSNEFIELQNKILRMEKQLKLYDEIMGYKKEL